MREGFYIGPVMVHYYGMIIMFGVLAASWLAMKRAKQYAQNPEIVWDLLPWALIGGIIGARMWFILLPSQAMTSQGYNTMYYLTHPLDALAIWNGGLGIPGAVIGGALAAYLYTHKNKLSFLTWTDIIAPGLILAQSIGRWGNFVNQELYGPPTDLPWGIYIEPAYRLRGFEHYERFHPLFLYESFYNLLVCIFLVWVSKRYKERLKPGYLFQFYLILYPFGRFMLEFMRLDIATVGLINANQTFMAIILLANLALLIYRERFVKKADNQLENSIEISDQEASDVGVNEDTKSTDEDAQGEVIPKQPS